MLCSLNQAQAMAGCAVTSSVYKYFFFTGLQTYASRCFCADARALALLWCWCRWLPKVPQRSYWGLHGQQLPDLSTLIHNAWELRLATTTRQQHQRQPLPTALNPAELHGLAQQAKTLLATYLTKARQRPGLVHADGVDTLLLQLLCDVGDAAAVEALLLGQHAAAAAAVEPALRAAGRWHGLALLQLHAGEYQAALDTWKVGGVWAPG